MLGGIDTLVNHELLARLPQRRDARGEIGLHSLRDGARRVDREPHPRAAAGWSREPSGFQARDYGWLSWLLSVLALAAAFWCARDFLAWRRLRAA